MKKIVSEMLKVYKPISGLDWMNYVIVRKPDMTAHHIIKKENGGSLEWGNVALLLPPAHGFLHLIEAKNFEMYEELNWILLAVNQQMHEPTTRQRELVEHLLRQFETDYEKERTRKGKKLIKWEYKQRGFYK